MYIDYLETPIGWLQLIANEHALLEINFIEKPDENNYSPNGITSLARKQLQEYFSYERRYFEVPLEPQGSAFQKQVWQALLKIPYGETVNYKQIAQGIKKPKAVRAVGSANGKNPIPIIIPCHRVIAADGQLGGYSAGLWRKNWLLKHENMAKI